MNYQKIYNDLINRGLKRGLDKSKLDYYTEKHHILPKCMGGTNDKTNLVLLTAREHFFAHELLYKIHRSKELAFALHKFFGGTKEQRLNSKYYSWIKEEVVKTQSETTKTMWANLSVDAKLKRASKVGKSGSKTKKAWSKTKKEEVSLNIKMGYKKWAESLSDEELKLHSANIINKRTETLKSRPASWHAKYRENLASAMQNVKKILCIHCNRSFRPGNYALFHGDNCYKLTGKKHIREKLECPHCKAIMDKSHAKRYHFDNCKNRKT